MTNRIASLLSDDAITTPPDAPELDWTVLFEWIPALAEASEEGSKPDTVDVDAFRVALRRSGVLRWDGPEWVLAEGGLRAAVSKSYHRDLGYLRNTISALYNADEGDPMYIPVAIQYGSMYGLLMRGHSLIKSFEVIQDLIHGE